MGRNLAQLFSSLSKLPDEEVLDCVLGRDKEVWEEGLSALNLYTHYMWVLEDTCSPA